MGNWRVRASSETFGGGGSPSSSFRWPRGLLGAVFESRRDAASEALTAAICWVSPSSGASGWVELGGMEEGLRAGRIDPGRGTLNRLGARKVPGSSSGTARPLAFESASTSGSRDFARRPGSGWISERTSSPTGVGGSSPASPGSGGVFRVIAS